MTKNKKAQLIKKILNKYFPNPKIPLKYKNLFTLTIAVILSAQTTDKKVNEITDILFKRVLNPKQLLNIKQKELENILKPLGLYKKKTNALIKLSKILIKKYNSKLPCNFEELESLPGIGHKTASVIMSHGFNKFAFPVDTHIYRCAKRWKLSDGISIKKTEKDLKKFFNKKDWNKIHLQIIYFARKYCKAKNHKINLCPMCKMLNS